MKKCTKCLDWKFDNEFGLVYRRVIQDDGVGGGEILIGRTAYVNSWCKECVARYKRLKRGTQTSLDVATHILIELSKEEA